MRLTVRLAAIALAMAGLASTATTAWAADPPNPGSSLWKASVTDAQADGTHGQVLASSDGSTIYVSGGSNETVTAYSASAGTALWTASNPDAASSYGAMALSPDGSTIYVTASPEATPDEFETVAYSTATGATLWSVSSAQAPYAFATSIAVSPDSSTVYVAGWKETTNGTSSYYSIAAYAAATGDSIWQAAYTGPEKRSSAPFMAVTPDGSQVVLAGSTTTSTGVAEYATVAFAASTGALNWSNILPLTGGSSPTAVAVSPDSSTVFVTGTYTPSAHPRVSGSATVAYDASTGQEIWIARMPGGTGPLNGNDMAAVTVSPDGSTVYTTGQVSHESSSAYLTAAYDAATGAQLWRTVYNGPTGSNAADAVTASPDGNTVYVTGEADPFVAGTTTIRASDYATVAYDAATGARLWATIRQGASGQHLVAARSVAVSPDNSTVFVSGYANGAIVTLAYQG